MEVVNIFNKELKSILDAKLPVSRHKMSLITKSAMKALKFYKHVVQSVEKFIAKCSCDYKVPGLYVIDAIVRQSKHQYCDKDVFVPRFMRNIVTTFIYLSQCDSKDLSSIERVLRLWQQNGVFPTDLVESLLEIVYDSSDYEKVLKSSNIVMNLVNKWNLQKGKSEEKLETFIPSSDLLHPNIDNSDETSINKMEGGLIDSITKLLTKFHAETGQDVSTEINQIRSLHQKIVEQSALLAQGHMIDAETLSQLHQSMEELTKKAAKAAAVQQSKLAMLSTDDNKDNLDSTTDMEFVEQLQQMVDTLGQTRALQLELRQAIEEKHKADESKTDISQDNNFSEDKDLRAIQIDEASNNNGVSDNRDVDLRILENHNNSSYHYYNSSENGAIGNDAASTTSSRDRHKRHRSKSGSQNSKRRRSHSKEKRKKEKKPKELRRKYQPTLKPNFVGIISHTVFIGHLNKHLSETKLKTMCEDFGEIKEFNMIPPRGCAFVTFSKRKSAHKAVSRLHEQKFEGRELKVAWAPNKGIKDDKDMREHWIELEGCTYVPVEQFPINRSSELIEGGAEVDDESVPEELKLAITQFEKQKADALALGMGPSSVETMITVAAEVANQHIPVSLDSTIDTHNSQFYLQYPPPPPMMPQMIPFHHHPHSYLPPIIPSIPISSNIDEHNNSSTPTGPTTPTLNQSTNAESTGEFEDSMEEGEHPEDNENVSNSNGNHILHSLPHRPPFPMLPHLSIGKDHPPPMGLRHHPPPPGFLRPPNLRNNPPIPRMLIRGRMFRPPMRYGPPLPPHRGFPFRTSARGGNRPPPPRF